jgi:hypothetical protein
MVQDELIRAGGSTTSPADMAAATIKGRDRLEATLLLLMSNHGSEN